MPEPIPSTAPAPEPPATESSSAARAEALLAHLWERHLPLLQERLQQLDDAAIAAHANTLAAEARSAAADTAHKLAGSLGMFGYPEGTDLARLLEQQLEREGPLDTARLTSRCEALRQTLGLARES